MATNEPTTNVGSLVARVTQSLANIDKHRAAMAQVAAQVKATVKPEPVSEVTK